MAPRIVELKLSFSKAAVDKLECKTFLVTANLEETIGKYKELGRTKEVGCANEGTFEDIIKLNFYFERVQKLQFCLQEPEENGNDKILGTAIANLSKIISEKTTTLSLSNDVANITICASEMPESSSVKFEMSAEGLDKKDMFGKSDPYVCIYKEETENKWKFVHKTEHIQNTLRPTWKPFIVDYSDLCNGDINTPLKLACYDHDTSRSDLIGECSVNLSEILNNDCPSTHLLVNPKRKAKNKKNYKKSGKLTIHKCKEIKHHSFVEYIFGGCKIHFTCGIDFTASNGDPRQTSSLHYTGGMQPNDYMKAIEAIGNIIQNYASDHQFPAYGFGAKVPPAKQVSHDFPLNLDPDNPACDGIDGIIKAYTEAIRKVKLWGPTNVAPIIQNVARLARTTHNDPVSQQYYVVLILTDGVVTDMDDTLQTIVDSSDLPMSVIIVGIGNADFTGMKVFDVNVKGKLKAPDGSSTIRSIVQFAPFRNFKLASTASFAASVLHEIPSQMVAYYKMHEIEPQVRQPGDSQSKRERNFSENISSDDATNQKDDVTCDSSDNDINIVQPSEQSAPREVDCNA